MNRSNRIPTIDLMTDSSTDTSDPECPPVKKKRVSQRASIPVSKRQKYRVDWEDEYPWLKQSEIDEFHFYCVLCEKNYLGGLTKIDKHESSYKHSSAALKDTEITVVEMKNVDTESFVKVHNMIPNTASYVVTSCESDGNDEKWDACVRASIDTREQAEEWLREFELLNHLDFRVRKTQRGNSNRLVFKREYRCHLNTLPRVSKSLNSNTKRKRIFITKNTFCPAYVRMTIKQTTMNRSSDMLLKKYPCEIIIKHHHNHPVIATDVLSKRRPSEETKQKFIALLQKGHSPMSALECHKFDLRLEHGPNYLKVAADASKCPSKFWIYKLQKKLVTQYGPQCGYNKTGEAQETDCPKNEEDSAKTTVNAPPPEEKIQGTIDSLSEIVSGWISQLKADPATLLTPFDTFIKNHNFVMKSQSSLISALRCFGKGVGSSALSTVKRKLSTIPVQPTAVARRTT